MKRQTTTTRYFAIAQTLVILTGLYPDENNAIASM